MPGDDGLGPRVRDNNDGTICVEYQPKCEGRHEVQMTHNGNAVKGTVTWFITSIPSVTVLGSRCAFAKELCHSL